MKFYIFNFLTSIYCMILHLVLTTMLSYIFSNTILIYSLFSGLYILSIGLGIFFAKEKSQPLKYIMRNSMIALFSGFFLLMIMITHEYLLINLRHGTDLTFITAILGVLFTILLGIISGVELPLLSQTELKSTFNKVISSDYFGAAFGILLFLILYAFFGLIGTIAISQLLLILSIVWLRIYKINYWLLIFSGCLSISIFLNKSNILDWIDSLSL